MNIAFFLIPKSHVAYLYDQNTIRQGIEKMKHHGYAAIPVITKEGKYVGTVSEGSFLWHIVANENAENSKIDINEEHTTIKDILSIGKNPAVRITVTMEELLIKVMDQNFAPVIDDRGFFMGIITRRDIIKYFYDKVCLECEKEYM